MLSIGNFVSQNCTSVFSVSLSFAPLKLLSIVRFSKRLRYVFDTYNVAYFYMASSFLILKSYFFVQLSITFDRITT